MYKTIISADELNGHLNAANWRIIDCHFELGDTEAGRQAYRQEHIPEAIYAHLDDDLSGSIVPGETGRHPLPSISTMTALFGDWGIDADTQVVVYDDKKGAIAARLWWMLRYLGHDKVAVLDGGLAQWKKAGYQLSQNSSLLRARQFIPQLKTGWIIDVDTVDRWKQQQGKIVVDSRTPERYRGEVEPIDPVAGHIPGAINLPFPDNWNADGLLRPAAELSARFALLPVAEHTAFYCGSGVTACHNILAYNHAGMGAARLYPGSWSEWIVEEKRPVATGEEY